MNKIVETKYGLVEGIENEKGFQFLGIPFAKPPIGELTFKHPVDPDKWDGVYSATKPKANPIQRKGTFSVGHNDLDCLYLNIYVPRLLKNESKKLPVMVWIFGGSFATGGTGLKDKKTTQIEYDCSEFVNDTNTIVVTFNYRLNLYGYSFLNAFDNRFDVNNGIYDQIKALKFVKDNIENFGGDSSNITVFGQSAGGASIIALLGIKECENLFNKAIVMSPVSEHFYTKKEGKKLAKKYLKYLGVKTSDLSKLYNISEETIVKANKKLANYAYMHGELRVPFSPIIDGVLLKEEPKFAAIKSNKPLLIGHVINEGNLFLLKAKDYFLPFMAKLFGLKVKKGDASYRYRASIALTHKLYIDPMLEILSSYNGKAYKYLYKYVSPDCKKLGVDTFHACDVPVLFNYNTHFEKVDDEDTQKVGLKMRKIFSKFAYDDFDEFEEYKINNKEIIFDKE